MNVERDPGDVRDEEDDDDGEEDERLPVVLVQLLLVRRRRVRAHHQPATLQRPVYLRCVKISSVGRISLFPIIGPLGK